MRARCQPDQWAYHFLLDGEAERAGLTYSELDRRARAIGACLQRSGAVGERVLLLLPPSLEYVVAFFGCLYAGAVAVPAYPPRANQSLARLLDVARDARARRIVTNSAIHAQVSALPQTDARAALGTPGHLQWLETDRVGMEMEECWKDPAVGSDALALLQYTSGSTAAPKGVMLSHGNLLHNLASIHQGFRMAEEGHVVSWLPPYHDMGLIGGLLEPLYAGIPVTLMSPLAFLQRPFRWLQAISNTRGCVSGGPNFAYDLCVRRVTPEQRSTLDLSHWNLAFSGAEPVRHETLERFAAAFESCGFRREAFQPCYGLAEASLIVSTQATPGRPKLHFVDGAALESNRVMTCAETDGGRALVGCGHALMDQSIAIVDPETLTRCAHGQVGEIWVSGPSVALGYWDRPEETRYTFRAYLADSGEGPFLRTGDLGFMDEGELFITGRLKDLIIIDGRNHYPQDIERTVEESHPSLRPGCCATFSVDLNGSEALVVVAEVERRFRALLAPNGRPAGPSPVACQLDPRPAQGESGDGREAATSAEVKAVVTAVRRAISEQHDLRVAAVVLSRPGTVPKTSSGKIQRRACRAAYLAGSLEPAEAREG